MTNGMGLSFQSWILYAFSFEKLLDPRFSNCSKMVFLLLPVYLDKGMNNKSIVKF